MNACERCGAKVGVDGACRACGLGMADAPPATGGVSNTPPQGATSGRPPGDEDVPERQSPRLLSCRVDALVVAFRVALAVDTAAALERARAVADIFRKAELVVGPAAYQLKPTRSHDRHYFANAEVRCLWDSKAAGGKFGDDPEPGWTLELTCRATYLATHSLAEALELLDSTAADFGQVFGSRVRRFDLACDFTGWAIRRRDLDVFVRRGRSMITNYLPAGDVPDAPGAGEDSRTYYDRKRRLTGYTVGMGGPICTRIYDKCRELLLEGNEDKRKLEEAIWRAQGWQGEDVTRVEFQLRGDALKEICGYFNADQDFVSPLRDPSCLRDKIDEAFHYLVGTLDGKNGWLRMVLPETATRAKRATIDPRWNALRGVVFFHAHRMQASRVRFRTGATLAMTIGCIVSLLADEDQIKRTSVWHPTEGFELSPGELSALGDAGRRAWIAERVDELTSRLGEVMRQGLGADPAGADRLLAVWNANIARLSTRKRS